ncbi:pantoate--beta-alanine ligase [Denitratisoma sp. agr-D3]
MHIHTTIASLRAALAKAGKVAFAPTMGNLHDGHISLMRQARDHGDVVATSIFVNRLQFRPGEDFDSYPRTFEADCEKLAAAGVDHLFAPNETEIYPRPQTFRVVPDPALADILEGQFRPGFFTGVATVVMKLFQIVQPQTALFGKKDYQQLMVIRNMVQDLNLPIAIVGGDTVRAEDGLALSSRNGYLSDIERKEAPRLFEVLTKVVEKIRQGSRDFPALERDASEMLRCNNWSPDYVAICKKSDLQSASAHDFELVVLAAARLGSTRLIDNLEV